MATPLAHRFEPALSEASFLGRPHRFAVLAQLRATGEVVEAHLADPGRLRELLRPRAELWLQPAGDPGRKTAYSARLVRAEAGELVSMDTQLPNRLVRNALESRALAAFASLQFVKAEARYGRSRFDFLLRNSRGVSHYLEVKSVSLVENGVALFPDATTERGRRHLAELAALHRGGREASVLFVVQRGDAREVRPARDRDPAFAKAMDEAARAGVVFHARACRFEPAGARWLGDLPVRLFD